MRIGHGYDVHRLAAGRSLILGGVTIPYDRGLDGHSDADVLTHAVEGFTASNAGTIPDLLAQDAFRTAFACLPASYAGDRSVRLRLHMASTLAGIAFSRSGLGLCLSLIHI